jgi:hypothetical protein
VTIRPGETTPLHPQQQPSSLALQPHRIQARRRRRICHSLAGMVSVDEVYAKHAFDLTTIAITAGLSAAMRCANLRSIDVSNKENLPTGPPKLEVPL